MIESRQKMAGAGDTMLALPARSQWIYGTMVWRLWQF
jgi:hypothetical protein